MSDSPATFDGLRIAAFESRRAEDMHRLIERHGGESFVSPSMREVAIEENSHAVEFGNRLITGGIDAVIFLTGVGFRHLLSAVEQGVDRQRFLNALSDIPTIARGPKPVAAMKEAGVNATIRVPEPNTWRELLTTIDDQLPVSNLTIGLQEYGKTNPSLIAGLEARGARIVSLRVYSWELPEDDGPISSAVHAIAAGERDACLFTSAQQVVNLLEIAERENIRDEVVRGLRRTVIASIGPTTSQALAEEKIAVDMEPTHPKMGHLVAEAAQLVPAILDRKKKVIRLLEDDSNDREVAANAPWHNSPFMRACRLEPTDTTPIWLMRQAGRYLPEYRKIRETTTFLELCKNPQLCAEVMVTTVNRLGVDAAIIFSDLLPILEPMGLDLEYSPGDGPLIHNPVREASDVDRVVALENVDSLHFVMETVSETRTNLSEDIPVIGFAGAPFTLASYTIEGGGSRTYLHTKTLMYRDEGAWRALMERFVHSVTIYLNAQIRAGAQCVQIFDSWVGCLSPADYRRYVLPHMRQIMSGLIPDVPVINFATGNPQLLPMLAEAGATVVGVDWRIGLADAWRMIGHQRAVQGNLEPAALLGDRAELFRRAKDVLNQAGGRPGHIFNLGHGVVPQTPVDNVLALIEYVHEFGKS